MYANLITARLKSEFIKAVCKQVSVTNLSHVSFS